MTTRSLVTIILLAAVIAPAARAAYVIDFEDVTYAPGQDFENGAHLGGGPFISRGAAFSNEYDAGFGSWEGFSYSRVNDPNTPGFGNQYAVASGTGVGGAGSYGVGFADGFGPTTITLPAASGVAGFYVNNTTYAYEVMAEGDDGFGNAFARQFGVNPPAHTGPNEGYPDLFSLTINGFDSAHSATGSVTVPLADYRFADDAQDYVLSAWTWVDLTSLGGTTKSLEFSLFSTDSGAFGINTPTYFAVDNITVPEPSAVGLLAVAGVAVAGRRRRRNGGIR